MNPLPMVLSCINKAYRRERYKMNRQLLLLIPQQRYDHACQAKQKVLCHTVLEDILPRTYDKRFDVFSVGWFCFAICNTGDIHLISF